MSGSVAARGVSLGTQTPQVWYVGLDALQRVGSQLPKPVSPALLSGFLAAGPPGKSPEVTFANAFVSTSASIFFPFVNVVSSIFTSASKYVTFPLLLNENS